MNIPKLTFQVSRGLNYSYYHTPPSQQSKQYILFLHGFPSLPIDYRHQIRHLSNLGYGILAPELLGYGDTSRPTDSDPYRLKLMSNDIVELLDHHSLHSVLAVGHDWGVHLLTRFEFYHPERITKIALLAIGSAPFGKPFDLDAVNAMMKSKLGYEGFGYQVFFTRDPEAADIINAHQESFRCVAYAADVEIWKKYLGALGGLKDFLLADRKTPTVKGFDEQTRKVHEVAFANDRGGYAATLNWYRNHVFEKNTPDEVAKLERKGLTAYQTTKPVLSLLAAYDAVALPPIHQPMVEAYAPQATVKILNTGHWVMLEAAEMVSQELEEFFSS